MSRKKIIFFGEKMAGGAAAGASYGTFAGGVFIFNLVVGVGALALPRVFSAPGLILGSLFLSLFAFLSSSLSSR
jgi:hypothetical protein